MRERSRTFRYWTLRIVTVLCALMPATAGWTQDGAKEDVPRQESNSGATDDPPPLRLNNKAKPAASQPTGDVNPKWVPYAADVSERVYAVIRADDQFHDGLRGFEGMVRLWFNPEGRVTDLQLDHSRGDPAVAAALKDLVRTKLIVAPPPNGLPMPMTIKIVPYYSLTGGYAATFGNPRKWIDRDNHQLRNVP
jgi:TonB family protein